MRKIFFLAIFFLSAEAQRLKLNLSDNLREGIEISELNEVIDDISYRLPNETKPESYSISLEIGDFHLNEMNFTGTVSIAIRVVDNTDTIVLHSAVDVIDRETTLTNNKNIEIPHSVTYDSLREFMIIKVKNPLEKDSLVRLFISFKGQIGTSIKGVYRGSYWTKDDERRLLKI
jgi:hypothetical protein